MLSRLAIALLLATGVAHAHEDTYPMAAPEYRKRTAQRLERYKQRLEDRMREHALAEDRKRAARKRLAAVAVEIRKLVDRAARDDKVTQAEAHRIRDRTKRLREALYKELGFEVRKGE